MDNDAEDILQIFFDAIEENNVDVLKSRLNSQDSNLKINEINNSGHPLLHLAVANNNIEIVKLLIEKGADLNLTDEKRKTVLHIAAGCSSLTMMKMLLEKNVDCQKLDLTGRTPLHYLVSCNEQCDEIVKDMVDSLINCGADINALDTHKLSPLTLSIMTKRSNISQYLINLGADVNGNENHMPIFIAIYNSEIDTIRCLIDHGARVDLVHEENHSTVTTAIYHIVNKDSRYKVIKWLLEAEANVNHHSTDGVTLLHMALMQHDIDIFHLLVEKGASIHTKNLKNHSPLFTAVTFRFYEGAKALIEMGAEVDDCDINGFSIFSSAVFHNNSDEMLKLLINHGADPKSRLEMLIAASEGYLRIMKLFVSYGAIIDRKEKYWLCVNAIKNLHLDVIQYLLEIEVDLNYMCEEKTLLRRAFKICKNKDQNENENTDLKEPAKLLIKYIAIRLAKGLDVHELNIELIHSKRWAVEHYETCKKELSLMKSTKIYEDESNRTYFHLLTKRHTKLANCLRNDNVRSVLKTGDYKNSFKIYSNILEENYLWGVERLEKLNEFEAIVGEALGSVFPDSIIKKICEYF